LRDEFAMAQGRELINLEWTPQAAKVKNVDVRGVLVVN
jgi:hypothetical protein